MTLIDLITAALTLWIVTHTFSMEIPFLAKQGKPFSCQLCTSGWITIGVGLATIILAAWPGWEYDFQIRYLAQCGAVWAGSVLIEAVHGRLQTIII